MDVIPLINAVIAREGGYVNNPNDRGGATNFGITEAVARAQGFSGDMRSLARTQAVDIYTRLYWLKPGLNLIGDIAPKLAAKLLDIGVNMGPASALGFLKRALNVLNRNGEGHLPLAPAPVVDSATLDALTTYLHARGASAEAVLIKAINAMQGERYIVLAEQRPADQAFIYGWLNSRIG